MAMDALLSSDLSADTLAALQAHLKEQEQAKSENVSEDFRLSQFWYDDKTAAALAKEAFEMSANKTIAFVSTPAAYRALLEIVEDHEKLQNVFLFEYDHRFSEKYGEQFVFYDYNTPTELPERFHHFFDYILVDPPYLNVNCMSKFAETMRWLAKNIEQVEPNSDNKARIFNPCTFITARMLRKDIQREIGFKPTGFYPTFESKLSNQFLTYTNYSSARFGPCTEEFDEE